MTTRAWGGRQLAAGDGEDKLAVAAVVFIFCCLSLLLTGGNLHLSPQPPASVPVGLLLSRASEMSLLYLSTAACGCAAGWGIGETLQRVRRTWRSPAATLLYIDLLAAASSSVLWMLTAVAKTIDGAAKEGLFFLSLAALALWLGPVLFAHSEIACKVSVVVAALEEREGAAALKRAADLVKGRRLEGLVLTVALAQLEHATAAAAGGSIPAATGHLAVRFLSCIVYTKFYLECEKRHRREKDRWIADRRSINPDH